MRTESVCKELVDFFKKRRRERREALGKNPETGGGRGEVVSSPRPPFRGRTEGGTRAAVERVTGGRGDGSTHSPAVWLNRRANEATEEKKERERLR